MKIFYYIGIILIFSLQITCVSFGQGKVYEQEKFDRKPFQKSAYVIKQPEMRTEREGADGESIDVNAKVVEIDKAQGKYEFRWIGSDGKEKIVSYQRHDAIDAFVEAKVDKQPKGGFIYKYEIMMTPDSPVHFHAFTVQTFAADSEVRELDGGRFLFGKMKFNPLFKEGTWWDWGFIGKTEERIKGGDSIDFQLTSKALPGIVNCKAIGGDWGTKGVGEHMPTYLENEVPIFQDLASSYTLGPDEKLSELSDIERSKYLLDSLPKFKEAGWMTEGTAKNYEQILKRNDLKGTFEKAKKDLAGGFISNEVFQIIEGLSQ